jgi:hypothetical protein
MKPILPSIILACCLTQLASASQYFQDFFSSSLGATTFDDGSKLVSNDNTAQVVDPNLHELQLTAVGTASTRSAYLLPDLDGGKPVYAFSAKWSSPVYAPFPTGADGFSFTFGQVASLDLTNSTYPQETGYGVGLSFAVHTYRDSRPGFYIFAGTNEVAYLTNSSANWGNNTDQRHFFEVDWNYYRGITVRMDNQTLFANVAVTNFTPQGGDRFVWAARCGAETEFFRVDNIAICTGGNYVQLPSSAPYFANNDLIGAKANAFDESDSTFWAAIGAVPSYVGATFAPSNVATLFAVTSPDLASRSGDPQTFTFDGSNDGGGSWTTLGSGSGYFAGRKETRCWPGTSSTAFTAYRLNVTETSVPNSGTYLGELRAYAFTPVLPLWRKTGAPSLQYNSIACSADGRKIYVATTAGIWASYDGGATWIQTSASQDNIKGIACSTNGNVVAAGYQSYVTTSIDSGTNWGSYQFTGGSAVNFFALSDDGRVMLSGGYVSVSTDTGGTWNTTPLGAIGDGGVAVCKNGGLLIVAGHTSFGIYTSTNTGTTWQMTAAPNANYNGLAASADGSIILAVAYGDGIYVSTNSGATFLHTNMVAPWFGASMSADGKKFAIQNLNGQVLFSTDFGASWIQSNPPVDGYPSWDHSATAANGETFVIGYPYEIWANISRSPTSIPVSLKMANNSPLLSWSAASSFLSLQRSTDLINWTDVPYPAKLNGFSFEVTDLPQNGKAFYRLKSP